jgi:hypothetical protein
VIAVLAYCEYAVWFNLVKSVVGFSVRDFDFVISEVFELLSGDIFNHYRIGWFGAIMVGGGVKY